MGAKNAKLVQKLLRRSKYVKNGQSQFKYDRVYKTEKYLRKSNGGFELMRDVARKLEANWETGVEAGYKPVLAYEAEASAVARVTYMAGHAIRFTVSAAVLVGNGNGAGIQPGDYVFVEQGALKNKQLTVLAILSSTQFVCTDVSTYTSETNINFRCFMNSQPYSYY